MLFGKKKAAPANTNVKVEVVLTGTLNAQLRYEGALQGTKALDFFNRVSKLCEKHGLKLTENEKRS